MSDDCVHSVRSHYKLRAPTQIRRYLNGSKVKIALVIYPITVYTVIGLTTCCILTFEPLQGLSLLRWGPQLLVLMPTLLIDRMLVEDMKVDANIIFQDLILWPHPLNLRKKKRKTKYGGTGDTEGDGSKIE